MTCRDSVLTRVARFSAPVEHNRQNGDSQRENVRDRNSHRAEHLSILPYSVYPPSRGSTVVKTLLVVDPPMLLEFGRRVFETVCIGPGEDDGFRSAIRGDRAAGVTLESIYFVLK